MKTRIIFQSLAIIFSFFFSLGTYAQTSTQGQDQLIALEIAANQLVHLHVLPPSNSTKPTFLLLPGVNRAVVANDPSVVALRELGFGVAIMNFSTQPFSVNLLKEGVTPHFKSKTLKLSDFVSEVEQVILFLRDQKSIQQIIPVSLSFSAAVTPYLQTVKETIEVAPLTSSAATNPQLDQYIRTLKSGEVFNPFFGPSITRSTLDSVYRSEWSSVVDFQIQNFNLNPKHKSNMIEGYISMSRVVELFDWKSIQINPKVQRTFLIASEEAKSLRRNQGQTVLNLLKNKVPTFTYLIQGAGHVIPADQPVAFAKALSHSVEVGLSQGGVAEVSAGEGKVTVLDESAALSCLRAFAN